MTVAEATTQVRLLRNMADTMNDNRMKEALTMAIRSLEAWEKVNEEIKGLDWNGDDAYWYGVSDVSAMIDKHLGEVTQNNDISGTH